MSPFNIEVITSKSRKIWDLYAHIGRITMGTFHELFYMPTNSWNTKDYQKQWNEGLEQIKTRDISCLVTTIQNILDNPLVIMWLLYKEDTTIFFQQHMLNASIIAYSGDQSPPLYKFNKDNCYSYIATPRQQVVERETISQWSICIDDFFASLER